VRDDATDADEVVVCDKDVMISRTNQMEVCDAEVVTMCNEARCRGSASERSSGCPLV
jgi:hypothetical protein